MLSAKVVDNVAASNNCISGSVYPMFSYPNLPFFLLLSFFHPWTAKQQILELYSCFQ